MVKKKKKKKIAQEVTSASSRSSHVHTPANNNAGQTFQ